MHLKKNFPRKGNELLKRLEKMVSRAHTEPGRMPIPTAKIETFMIYGHQLEHKERFCLSTGKNESYIKKIWSCITNIKTKPKMIQVT